MAVYNFNAKFHGHGFDLEKDISKEVKERVQAELIAMYNMFAEMSNKVLDKINGTWDRYEHIKKLDDLLNSDHLATKATLNAPSANRLRNRFGSLNATKNASAIIPAPRKFAISKSRMKPRTRLTIVQPPTVRMDLMTEKGAGIECVQ